jgi:hypothetical protein
VRGTRHALLLPLLGALLLAAPPEAASYTDQFGTNFSFTSINETSTWGDALPLFDQPTAVGDQLVFTPDPDFMASATGNLGNDQTGAQLQLVITATGANATIQSVLIDESGFTDLSGVGTSGTGTFASMAGFLTVTEDINGLITPVVIPFVGVFTPTDLLGLPGDAGVTNWTGSVFIDVAAYVTDAYKATLSFDNDIYAASETGTTAEITKTGVTITVIPEPGTLLLLGGGLLALALAGRRSTH